MKSVDSAFGNQSISGSEDVKAEKAPTVLIPGSISNEEATRRRGSSTWLHAWYDPVAGLRVSSHSCLNVADLNGDGDHKLLVVDCEKKKLKVFKGTSILSEHLLLSSPCAMTVFYSETGLTVLPTIAIASGPHVFIYKNLRPFFKFTVPEIPISEQELDIWKSLELGSLPLSDAITSLAALRDEGVLLTGRSAILLGTAQDSQLEFVDRYKDSPLTNFTTITCMTKLNKSSEDQKAVSMVVIGTENNSVHILSTSGTKILKTIEIPDTPAFIETTGLLDVNYRVIVACRNGRVHTVKNGKLLASTIELETQICGLVVCTKTIVLGCMFGYLHFFHIKGSKKFSIKMPSSITNMTKFELKRASNLEGVLVALQSGEVRMYNGKNLLTTISCSSPVTGMRFGQYGREDATLVMVSKTGSLTLKILQRQAQLEALVQTSTLAEQDIPLNIPKRTQLYVDQTERERENAPEMHRVFHRDLCQLRLTTARAFVKVISDGQGPLANTGSSARLNASIRGVGPVFKLRLSLKNTGTLPITNIPVTLLYNQDIYAVKKTCFQVPVLLPDIAYETEVPVRCIDPNGAADEIRVFVCNPRSCVPMISAIITMPVSDVVMPI